MRYFFVFFLSFSLVHGQKLYQEKINFEYKSSALTAENIKVIKSLWERLPVDAALELLLTSDKEQRKLEPLKLVTLSKARAEAINLFLVTQKLVSPYDIEINKHSFIESENIHNSKASFDRVVRDPYKVYSIILSKEVPPCYNYTNAERIALNSKAPSVFMINPSQDQTITGPGGVIVQIPANSFIIPADKKEAGVIIKLWEFLTMQDILSAGLVTSSEGKLLETGGMIYITAENDGNCLRLIRSSKMIVKFPVWQKQEGMQLFKGVPYPGIIDWKPTNKFDSQQPAVPEELSSFDEGGDYEGEDSASLQYYVLEASGLGWINCDRFYDAEEKIELAIKSPDKFRGVAVLVFTEIKSVLAGYLVNAKQPLVLFNDIPKGMEVVLLFYEVSKDKKKVQYDKHKIIAGEALDIKWNFTEVNTNEFKNILSSATY